VLFKINIIKNKEGISILQLTEELLTEW